MSEESILIIAAEVMMERRRQDERWGVQNYPNGTGGFDAHQAAVEAQRICEAHRAVGTLAMKHILDEEVKEAFAESDPKRLREELVQVSAVAEMWIDKLDREHGGGAYE